MPTPVKEAQIKAIQEKLKKSKCVVFVDYRGLNVKEDTDLRQKLRRAGVEYQVVKNTLAGIAARQAGIDGVDPLLAGPTSLAFGYQDPVLPAKMLSEYARESKKLQFKGGLLDGKLITLEQLKTLASLPSKEVLLSTLVGRLQAPIYGLVNVLQGPVRKLVYALEAVRKQKAGEV
ncbi:MAG: 50S ribosomal protein L10 [Bacillota bacterium]